MSATGPGISLIEARRRDRDRAWAWASTLRGASTRVWRLEAVKNMIAVCEDLPGSLPDPAAQLRLGTPKQALLALKFLGAGLVASILFLLWFLRFGVLNGGARIPAGARRLVAIHAEITNRTRHVLLAVQTSQRPFAAAIVLGRVRTTPLGLSRALRRELGSFALPPLVLPVSVGAVVTSFGDWLAQMGEGLHDCLRLPVRPPFRELVGIAFRLRLGCAAARWWLRRGPEGCELVMGMTGTADTTLLESAVQAKGGHTVHAIHGQATGPNFAGISDTALFRSGHDADAYERLGLYGRCAVQEMTDIAPCPRAACGTLLLTNLAHPTNAGYRSRGPCDEIALLRVVEEAAHRLGAAARPLLWKPHPALDTLPDAALVRQIARKAGFEEVERSADIGKLARTVRWSISSPSTVALDLLQAGVLSLILDPQCSLTDTALSALPLSECSPECLRELMANSDCPDRYEHAFRAAVDRVRPATQLTLDL